MNQAIERPIRLNSEMTQAILDGRKTQLRRLLKLPKSYYFESLENGIAVDSTIKNTLHVKCLTSDLGSTGDLLRVSWAERILLEITNVRVERIQDINEQDAIEEGVKQLRPGYWKHYNDDWTEFQLSAKSSFITLFKSIYGDEKWHENPWVWVIEFKKVDA